jgi:hypothetical protein
VLQAYFGVQIARGLTRDRVQQALGGCLFALTPLLPARAAHVALCALFFLTFGIALHLRPCSTRDDAWRLRRSAVFMLIWAAGTHGYLSVMLLVLVLAWLVRVATSDALLSPREALLGALTCLLASLGTYYLFGYIGWRPTELGEEGFGQFSGDLSALFNPQIWSRLFA